MDWLESIFVAADITCFFFGGRLWKSQNKICFKNPSLEQRQFVALRRHGWKVLFECTSVAVG